MLLAGALAGCYAEHQDSEPSSAPAADTPLRTVATPSIVAAAEDPPRCVPSRSLFGGELNNARDLGGTPLLPSGSVACGELLRGPPLRLSAEGCQQAAQLGIRTVIDLRTVSEREGTPDASCVDANSVLAPMPVPYGLSADDYLRDLHETAAVAAAFHAFGDSKAYPIYFHCTVGRDRTGIVAALVLLVLGATRDTVMHEYLLSEKYVGAFPDALNAVLDEVEANGGAAEFLKLAGISEAELSVLRQHISVN